MQRSIYDDFRKHSRQSQEPAAGDQWIQAPGPLISRGQLDRRSNTLRRPPSGRETNRRRQSSGLAVFDAGYFIEPTIFADTRPDMRIVREEIFGPVPLWRRSTTSGCAEAGQQQQFGLGAFGGRATLAARIALFAISTAGSYGSTTTTRTTPAQWEASGQRYGKKNGWHSASRLLQGAERHQSGWVAISPDWCGGNRYGRTEIMENRSMSRPRCAPPVMRFSKLAAAWRQRPVFGTDHAG